MMTPKAALVVGAGSDLGRSIVASLANNGTTSIICADIDLDAAQDNVNLLKFMYPPSLSLSAVKVDVTDEESVKALVEGMKETLHCFIYAAGAPNPSKAPLHETSIEDYRHMDDVHNVGAFVCLREVIKKMRSQQTLMEHEPALPDPTYEFQFAIVVVTSTTAEGGHAGVGPFAAAKHAGKSLVETAAIENADLNIRVNAVAPSWVKGSTLDQMKTADEKQRISQSLPMKRFAAPAEIADCVAFLCSGDSSYVSGMTMPVDGAQRHAEV